MYWKFITNRLGQYKPNKATSEMVKKLIEGVGGSESNTTRRQYFRYIRMFFRWCVLEKYIQTDPTDGIRTIRVQPKEIQIYSPDDIERLLRLCETKYPALLGFFCLNVALLNTSVTALVRLTPEGISQHLEGGFSQQLVRFP